MRLQGGKGALLVEAHKPAIADIGRKDCRKPSLGALRVHRRLQGCAKEETLTSFPTWLRRGERKRAGVLEDGGPIAGSQGQVRPGRCYPT
jgi:hypothetical protein